MYPPRSVEIPEGKRALLNQPVGAFALRRKDTARYGENFASLFGGEFGGD